MRRSSLWTAGGPAFKLQKQPQPRVPRPLRNVQRAGTTNAYATEFVRKKKSCVGSIATHPCKERKDGAPSVGVA